ncbi:MAG: hypothetical protein GF335_00130 [Candidatus Moranbacteria bacterium]|nr:hypothetical protein [Candidatus Moranbacteria bacterium]
MAKKTKAAKECKKYFTRCDSSGAVYGLGLVGALIYYLSNAAGFVDGIIGILKALLWPGFMVYELLKFLNM